MTTSSLPTPQQTVALINDRQSVGHLIEPAPTPDQIKQAIQAALTAPDHHRLRPWRFVLIQEERRQAFGELLVECAKAEGESDPSLLERLRHQPLRAPLLIVCLMKYQPHPKVPYEEQVLSCGAAIQNLLLTFQAQGYATIWRSGLLSHQSSLKEEFGCQGQDLITGIIYVGTASKALAARDELPIDDYIQNF